MNEKNTHKHGLATTAAAVRASIRSGMTIGKAFEHMKFIFSTLDITGQNSYEKFLEEMQDEDKIDQLAEAVGDYCDFDGLIQFLTAMFDTSDNIFINKVKTPDSFTNKKVCSKNLKGIKLKQLLKEMLEVTTSKVAIESNHNTALDDKGLNIIGCEIKRMKLPDMQYARYIDIPDKPFSVLKKDFDTAVHFKVLSDIADKFDEAEETRVMFVVENEQTGLLACSYLSALLDKEKYSDCEEDDDEQGVDFSEKVLMINALEIRSEDQRSAFRDLPFPNGGLGMQAIGSIGNNTPWFEKYVSMCPLIVMLNDTSFIQKDLPIRLNELGQSFDDIFVICVQEPENNIKLNVLDPDSFCSKNIAEIANDISFESNYDTYRIEEPEITSLYYRKVMEGAAAEEGYRIDENVDFNEILKNLKKFRTHTWNSNLTILQMIKKAISLKSNDKILKQQDFDFLKSSVIMTEKQAEKPAESEKNAVEIMNNWIYGLDNVKKTILDTVSVLKMRSEREKAGLKPPCINNTFVFLGPPGAGKTEMAEHLTKILFENDLLPGKRFVNINAAQLKGAYVGQTAPKVTAIFENNDALFLDEAYSLTAQSGKGSMDTYSQEALAQLCVELERHAKDKLVIFAGYGGDVDSENNKMKEFLNANPGIASRITFTVEFPSYSPDNEMPEIFNKIVTNAEYDLENGWRDIVIEFFKERAKSESFGNGREARRLFQNAMVVQAARLYGKKADIAAMRLITCDDLKTAVARLLKSERQVLGKQQYKIGFSF